MRTGLWVQMCWYKCVGMQVYMEVQMWGVWHVPYACPGGRLCHLRLCHSDTVPDPCWGQPEAAGLGDPGSREVPTLPSLPLNPIFNFPALNCTCSHVSSPSIHTPSLSSHHLQHLHHPFPLLSFPLPASLLHPRSQASLNLSCPLVAVSQLCSLLQTDYGVR